MARRNMKFQKFHTLLQWESRLVPYLQLLLPGSVIAEISVDPKHFTLQLLQSFESVVGYVAFRNIGNLRWSEENYTIKETVNKVDSRPHKKPEHEEYITTVQFAIAYADSLKPRIAFLNEDEHGPQENLRSLAELLRASQSADSNREFKYVFKHSLKSLPEDGALPEVLIQENLGIYKIEPDRYPNF
jgi:hypothetical protein